MSIASVWPLETPPASMALSPDESQLHVLVEGLLACPDLDGMLAAEDYLFDWLTETLTSTIERAFSEGSKAALHDVHRSLYALYEENIRQPGPGVGLNQYHPFIMRIRHDLESAWERAELARIGGSIDKAPTEPAEFIVRFRAECALHRLTGHPLFDYLENEASYGSMVDFLLHEGMLALRFCDLVALSLVGASDGVRSELAHNLWDEVGAGDYQVRHIELFRQLLRGVGVPADDDALLSKTFLENLGWQGLAGYNLYLYLSLHRRNYFRYVGCMGAAEMMDPAQYEKIVTGCRRVGLTDRRSLPYYEGHAEMDVLHGDGWLDDVIKPLLKSHPETARDILCGAVMRMNTAAEYYDFLLAKLSRGAPTDSATRGEVRKIRAVGM